MVYLQEKRPVCVVRIRCASGIADVRGSNACSGDDDVTQTNGISDSVHAPRGPNSGAASNGGHRGRVHHRVQLPTCGDVSGAIHLQKQPHVYRTEAMITKCARSYIRPGIEW